MYVPAAFAPADDDVRDLLAGVRAVDLVTSTAGGLLATFLPVVFDATANSLLAHLARNNDQWHTPPIGETLAIVHGADAYISPGWYASKAEHGRVVPTWNYVTAHIYGELVVHDDPEWVAAMVERLTQRQEADREQPWSVRDAPEKFIAGQLRAIVGVELRISRVEAKFKLSQNRPPADLDGVVAGLTATGEDTMAAAVEANRP
jgi:transcriptional regulator